MCLGHFVLSSLATSKSCNFGLLDRQSQSQFESNDLRTEDRQAHSPLTLEGYDVPSSALRVPDNCR
ncbi:GM15182 [Drosophila sechellia]|uniref:GM15182 n=1 Tax=Drosophila sechellia TaxID=7238 RepID=B4IBR3_DROSE|nr:GM15182 [Drosophila sechellia]